MSVFNSSLYKLNGWRNKTDNDALRIQIAEAISNFYGLPDYFLSSPGNKGDEEANLVGKIKFFCFLVAVQQADENISSSKALKRVLSLLEDKKSGPGQQEYYNMCRKKFFVWACCLKSK